MLYVFWELLQRLSRDSWEPFEEHQGACCCQERSAVGGCDHPETLTVGEGQKPAQHRDAEGESGWILSETCSLMSFNPSCTKGEASSTSFYQVGKWRLPRRELMSWPTMSHQPEGNWLESSFAEKALEVLVASRLSMSQPRALAARKAISLPGCIRQIIASRSVEVILSLCSALLRHIWSAVPSAGLPGTRETWTYRSEPGEGLEASAVQRETEGTDIVQPGGAKAPGDPSNRCKYLMVGIKKTKARLFPEVPSGSTGGNGHKLKYKKLH